MWKSTTGNNIPSQASKLNTDDDDWETDPNYINDVSEQDQRWAPGAKDNSSPKAPTNMTGLTKQVITQNELDSKKKWEALNGKDIKNSYGVDKTKKI